MEETAFQETDGIPTILIFRNRIFREGLQCLLSQNAYSVMDQGPDLDSIDTGRTESCGGRPSLIVIESVANGPEIGTQINRIKNLFEGGKIVIIAEDPCKSHLKACFDVGADGYILPETSSAVFLESLRLVTLGQNVFPAKFAMWMGDDENEDDLRSQNRNRNIHVNDLPEKERYILQMLVGGMSNKHMQKHLCLPEEKVKVLLYKVLRKIAAANRVQGAVWAVKHGISAFDDAAERLDGNPENYRVGESEAELKAGSR